jgi:hypothetical protein
VLIQIGPCVVLDQRLCGNSSRFVRGTYQRMCGNLNRFVRGNLAEAVW